ncbi:class I SAM-dependent RNA methyltransferase [Elstera cyanobacteriorum]|uniref:class I SAM-dependent RNA methyltransferase n=1 Tax=Elstera cyanobacteriorum TaxID=2022747 RepID=UPI002357CE23|nr:TRAM domain-containing protein [Elstera cyanobacteriorum]MCK6441139.1 class I SAM-dependent RNA methyltransferase [Elstera cyanobacteriorum]
MRPGKSNRSSGPRRPAPKGKDRRGERVRVTIDRLGVQGDGLAQVDGVPLFVLGALPGETVEAVLTAPRGDGWAARTETVVADANPDRIAPICGLFGRCGGCSLHHLSDTAQTALKTDRIRRALQRQGFESVPMRPLVMSPSASRRRASFAARRTVKGVILGFHEAASATILPLEACPLLRPALVAALPPLRDALADILPAGGTVDLVMTESGAGLDVALIGLAAPTLPQRETLAALADRLDLARLAWAPDATSPVESLAERRAPWLPLGGVRAIVPPGGFLQATAEGEAALLAGVRAALAGVPARAPIFDLFAGLGTFALPLAADGFRVTAVEGLADPLTALDRAARQAMLSVTTQQRDLERRPLLAAELAGAAAIVIDPPRAGAKAQSQELAASTVPVIAAVSCNPDSFARDAALLAEGGYRLDWVQPVDQFRWSPHVELVARFSR